MPKRTYSDTDKAYALALLDANGGNLARAAREAGVPRKTLQEWRDGRTSPDVAEIRHQKRADFAEQWEQIATLSLELLLENNGAALRTLDFEKLVRVAGIATDKILALRKSEAEAGEDDADDDYEEEIRPEQVEAWAALLRLEQSGQFLTA